MTKISGHGRYEWKWKNLIKLSKDIKFNTAHTGKTDKMSENNEIVDKLGSCLIKTRILKFAREQIQNKPARKIDSKYVKVYPLRVKRKGSGEPNAIRTTL